MIPLKEPFKFQLDRELSPADIEDMPKQTTVSPVKMIHTRHHKLARLLAGGETNAAAAIQCGITPVRVNQLLKDPSFKELVTFYRERVDAAYIDLHEKLADLAGMSMDAIISRLDENPDDFTPDQLVAISKMGADRVGHGPSVKQEHSHTIDIGARLDAARRRLRDIRDVEDAEVIDGE